MDDPKNIIVNQHIVTDNIKRRTVIYCTTIKNIKIQSPKLTVKIIRMTI